MPRDSILDEAERKQQNSEENNGSEDAEGESEERERVTQRIPSDIIDEIDAVQKKYRHSSRNATINFMLDHAADDLLGRDE